MSSADDTDPAARGGRSPDPVSEPVGWPLVERRRDIDTVADPLPRRPLWMLRLAALTSAVLATLRPSADVGPAELVALGLAAAITAAECVRPAPQRPGRTTRTRLVAEFLTLLVAVAISGFWGSPVAVALLPGLVLTGLAFGVRPAVVAALVVATVVSGGHIAVDPSRSAVETSASWTLLALVLGWLAGLVNDAALTAIRQRERALVRASQLAEANALLFALQQLTQTLPASLDLDELVDSTLARIESLVPASAIALYLVTGPEPTLDLYRGRGALVPDAIGPDRASTDLTSALAATRTVLLQRLAPGASLSIGSTSAIYAALRARGSVVALLVIEAGEDTVLDAQHAEVVHGLAEPFGLAIDNARLFRRIGSAAADDERVRIARDLHDRVGSSLAFLGFEIDRARSLSSPDDATAPILDELRAHLTAVVRDVRDTLHDLRTDITDEMGLDALLGEHLRHIEERSGVAVRLDAHVTVRPPRPIERELWRIAVEALTNVERHARADVVSVTYRADDSVVLLRVHDDGVGFNPGTRRADSYGMVGMRERAETIGATLRVESTAGAGTAVTVELDMRPGAGR